MEILTILANLAFYGGILSLVCLLFLHFLSPEFQPSWRMVSEYALGKHKWLLTSFFILWGMSSVFLACLFWASTSGVWSALGSILVFISGMGAIMGGLFDVKHKLHGLSFTLGVPTLPIGALLMAYYLIKDQAWSPHRSSILLSTHLIWISLLLMVISMILIFSGFKKAGHAMGPNVEPPQFLPEGVIGLNGYANRFLVFCYIGWIILMARVFLLL